MKTFLHAPLAVAIVSICAPGAFADDNTTYLEQDGTNDALILQPGAANTAGDATRPMMQIGLGNTLSITQSGDGNVVGTRSSMGVDGLYQANLDPDPATANAATILQSSDGNAVGTVLQLTREQGPSALPLASGNRLRITQTGGDRNDVRFVLQDRGALRHGNTADIVMDGSRNRIQRVLQYTRDGGAATGTQPNSMDVRITGDRNGRGAFIAGSFADLAGARRSFLQQGDKSDPSYNIALTLEVNGDRNLFGVDQDGRFVQADAALTGERNQLGLRQDGTALEAVVTVTGDRNNMGIDQAGQDAAADVTVTGSDNAFGIVQTGPLGGLQQVTLSIDGNNNGYAIGTGGAGDSFTGAAGVAAASPLAVGLGFARGLIRQDGTLQDIDHTVIGDNNAFGFVQSGGGNSITGRQQGESNQAAIIQEGWFNAVNFQQVGAFNSVGIIQ